MFPFPGAWTDGGADPLVRGRPPGRLVDGGTHPILQENSEAQGDPRGPGISVKVRPFGFVSGHGLSRAVE
jgi:hypothetical protein